MTGFQGRLLVPGRKKIPGDTTGDTMFPGNLTGKLAGKGKE